MKVKVVVLALVSMILLISCANKDTKENTELEIGSQQNAEGVNEASSSIGGWQWTPSEESDFRN